MSAQIWLSNMKTLMLERMMTGAMADMPMTEDVPITNTNTADTQGIAETETSPDLAIRSEDSDTTVNDDEAKADMVAVTEDVPITNTENGETQGTTTTDTTPSPALSQELIWDYFQDPCASSKQQGSSLGPGMEASRDCVSPQATATGPAQPLRLAQCGGKRSASLGKLGELFPWIVLHVFPVPPPGSSHCKEHSPETDIPCHCGCKVTNGHSEAG
ncbi:hypothetical protein DUI87_30817 [Hirundo rustica rustica]|uniref:Uncharacterized protein n=1 Tax=Hirundo rustica rustica TaxID=333673 RepID=A0A3M0IVD4_HIRRU|nr:hypothetical protein DUI87_30817 [Hirundo rustica rustica]